MVEASTPGVSIYRLIERVYAAGVQWPGQSQLVILACPPGRKGFGSCLIEEELAHDLGGRVRLEVALAGLTFDVDAPLSEVLA